MKYAILGSCLSGSIAIALKRLGYQPSGVLPHVRTDAFVDYLKDQAALGAPAVVIDALVKEWGGGMPEQKADRLATRLRGQSKGRLRDFVEKLAQANVLLVDNNYDLSGSTITVRRPEGVFRFSNVDAPGDAVGVERGGLMPMDAVAGCYADLVQEVRAINPRLDVFFFNFPTSGYEAAGTLPQRVERARGFGANMPEMHGFTAFPLVRLERRHLTAKGARYFTEPVYDAYARAVDTVVRGLKPPFPSAGEITLETLEWFGAEALASMDDEDDA